MPALLVQRNVAVIRHTAAIQQDKDGSIAIEALEQEQEHWSTGAEGWAWSNAANRISRTCVLPNPIQFAHALKLCPQPNALKLCARA
eukprot:scaffold184717_cov19-Tisochrysis_lutea.AAC.1